MYVKESTFPEYESVSMYFPENILISGSCVQIY